MNKVTFKVIKTREQWKEIKFHPPIKFRFTNMTHKTHWSI